MIISFDVGIKNLSYCIISNNGSSLDIHDWNIVDLSRDEPVQTCTYNTKKGVCGKKSCYTLSGTAFFCGTHIKKCIMPPAPEEYYKSKTKMCKKHSEILCNHYPEQTNDNVIQYIFDNCSTKLSKPVSTAGIDLVNIGRAISSKLSEIIKGVSIDKVLIENQIGPIANRMKCIQGMLAQFFIERGVFDISFVSSSNKLRHFDVPKKTYKERKHSSIEITREILSQTDKLNKWGLFFAQHKKKDDLSDSFLQGLWYIRYM
jgi:Poxvirus A22 protein